MRTKMLGLAALMLGGLTVGTAASAAPFGEVYGEEFDAPRIERVADGCGPGFHQNPWGRCRPNDRGYGYGPPRGYGGPYRAYGPPRDYGYDRPRPRYYGGY